MHRTPLCAATAILIVASGCAKLTVTRVSAPATPSAAEAQHQETSGNGNGGNGGNGGESSRSRKKIAANGYFYALPRTVVSISIPVQRTDQTPGIYAQFTSVFFPGQSFLKKPAKNFSVGTPVITTRGEADPDHVFMVHTTSSHWFEKKTISLELTTDGVLKGSSGQVDDQRFEVAMELVRTAAAFAGQATFAAGQPPPPPPAKPQEISEPEEVLIRHLPAHLRHCYSTSLTSEERRFFLEVLAAHEEQRDGFCGLAQEDRATFMAIKQPKDRARYLAWNRDKWKFYQGLGGEKATLFAALPTAEQDIVWVNGAARLEHYRHPSNDLPADLTPEETSLLSGLSPQQRPAFLRLSKTGRNGILDAAAVYSAILDLEARRRDFLLAPKPAESGKDAIEAMLQQIDDEINSRKELWFLGATATSTWTPVYVVHPSETVTSFPLFGVNLAGGLCKLRSQSGVQPQSPSLHPRFEDTSVGGCLEKKPWIVTLDLTPDKTPSVARVLEVRVEHASKGRSYFYRQPRVVIARLRLQRPEQEPHEADLLAVAEVPIAQFGTVISLPESTGGRTTKYAVKLDPATGALISSEVNGEMLVKASDVGTLGTTAQDLTAAIKKAQKDAAAANSEAARLEKEVKILQLLKEKKTLTETLNSGSPQQ